ncbi:MAG: dTDP-4-dehydrorhamnose 3,5-epimerase [Bacteroidetes bacterium]|nr:MAG: dTDP-4-dehydrorhamnose 3,5-epimerase [Bacteroidota bacterium]TNF00107.1 MAG: dTDP-4-dehydrorhamnose 3,5-epimerase [Bacteroidota bacterium]
MNIIQTGIKDLVVIEPKVFGDHRGYFTSPYIESAFNQLVGSTHFVQDNESKSSKGVLRGLHFQLPPYDQAKLVRVISGAVIDVAVDLRKDSPDYGKHYSILLSGENKKQLFVPRGFAHGFVVLENDTIFSYKVDNIYAPEFESGIIWNDPDLSIDWQLNGITPLLSDKDKELQSFKSFKSPF